MALERATWLEARYGAEIEWLPFDLHPEYPPEGVSLERLLQRYPEGFHERTVAMIEAAGFSYGRGDHIPNSMRALRLGELARDRGVLTDVHRLLFRAYWSEGKDIGDLSVLTAVAAEAHMSGPWVVEALEADRYDERIRASTDLAREFEMGGVPAWLIDGELVLVGAHPHEVFDQAMERLGHPPLDPPDAASA